MINNLGVQLYTINSYLQNEADIKNSFLKLKEHGYSEVQTAGWYTIPAEVLKDIADSAGIKIIGTHVPFDDILNDTKKVMELHKIYGTKNIGIGAMPNLWRLSGMDEIKAFVRQFNIVAKELYENGFKLTYHNHAVEFQKFNGITIMDYLVEEFNHDATSFVLDTYWVQFGGGDVIAWMKKLQGRIDILHLKDMVILENKPYFCEVFEGNMNFDGILQAAEEIKVTNYVVEQDVCIGDPFDSLKVSIENLNRKNYLKSQE